jgi:hypothetical protein
MYDEAFFIGMSMNLLVFKLQLNNWSLIFGKSRVSDFFVYWEIMLTSFDFQRVLIWIASIKVFIS